MHDLNLAEKIAVVIYAIGIVYGVGRYALTYKSTYKGARTKLEHFWVGVVWGLAGPIVAVEDACRWLGRQRCKC